ncbi:MAG: tRNA 2-thiouridine(34) synthase MnmA [Patescibacteria group bacterium UBA2163]
MKTVYVGLSGGVDSAVSAYLLKRQGYNVVGAFIKVWEPDFMPCTAQQDRLDAMRVAAHLEIPFKTYDLEEEYKRGVVDYFLDEYKAGRTPNPDVACNREVKFGAFWDVAKKDGADCIATGHYAQKKLIDGANALIRGVDEGKDQSYFLWTLTQDDLAHSLFPVGELPKSEVRSIAASINLPNARKKDSQGLCFLGHVDMQEFLQHYIPVKKGPVRLMDGTVLGEHDGVWFHTIGQRLSLAHGARLYIVAKNVKNNELIVAEEYTPKEYARATWTLRDCNWIRNVPRDGTSVEAEIRYHGTPHNASITGDQITFEEPLLVAPGQSIVCYHPETGECTGGGIVAGYV